MTCSLLALSLVCASPLSAPQQPLEVQDLLRGEAAASRFDTAGVVGRTRWREDHQHRRHVVSGEGHLAGHPSDGRVARAPQRFFTDATLRAALGGLRGGSGDRIELLRFGERIELRSSSAEQVAVALESLRRGLPPRARCAIRLERVRDGRVTVLLDGTEEFVNGETLPIGEVERTSLVVDAEVEIAQAAPSGNPVTCEVTYGSSALLRVRPLPFTDEAIVELVARHAEPFDVGPIPASGSIGPLNRLATRIDEAGLVFRVRRGGEVRHEWTDEDGDVLRLTCSVTWSGAERDDAGAIVTPLLRDPVFGFRSTRLGEREEPEELLPVSDMILSRVGGSGDGGGDGPSVVGKFGEEGVALLVDSGEARARAAAMFRQVDEALAPVALRVEVYSVPAGVEVPPQGPAGDDAELLWRASGPGVTGLPSCFTTGHERSYVRDWDIEVAQAARIADPKVDVDEDGWFATVKALPTRKGAPRRVDVALQRVHVAAMRQVEVPIAALSMASTESQEVVLPREVVTIEKPVTRSIALASTVALDGDGVAVLRRAAPMLLGDERELVVRVQAR